MMQTGQDTSLRSYLSGLLPDVLLAALAEGPGWLVHTDGAALTWEPTVRRRSRMKRSSCAGGTSPACAPSSASCGCPPTGRLPSR